MDLAPRLSALRSEAYSQRVRFSGVLAEQDRLAGADHLCWVYDDPASFVDAAGRYLAEGVARNERLLCVGDSLPAEFRAAGEPFGALDELIARGALRFTPIGAAYTGDKPLRPEGQRAFYDAAVRDARDAGFAGLRVVADVTPLAVADACRVELVRWEHLADEYIAGGSGMVAMCAYSRSALAEDAVADVAAVHPQVHSPRELPSFRVWFDDDRVAVTGTVDTFGADRLARVLADSPAQGSRIVLDLTALDGVDVAGCRVLARWARDLGARDAGLELAGAPRIVERIWRLVGLSDIAPVTFTERAR